MSHATVPVDSDTSLPRLMWKTLDPYHARIFSLARQSSRAAGG